MSAISDLLQISFFRSLSSKIILAKAGIAANVSRVTI